MGFNYPEGLESMKYSCKLTQSNTNFNSDDESIKSNNESIKDLSCKDIN